MWRKDSIYMENVERRGGFFRVFSRNMYGARAQHVAGVLGTCCVRARDTLRLRRSYMALKTYPAWHVIGVRVERKRPSRACGGRRGSPLGIHK